MSATLTAPAPVDVEALRTIRAQQDRDEQAEMDGIIRRHASGESVLSLPEQTDFLAYAKLTPEEFAKRIERLGEIDRNRAIVARKTELQQLKRRAAFARAESHARRKELEAELYVLGRQTGAIEGEASSLENAIHNATRVLGPGWESLHPDLASIPNLNMRTDEEYAEFASRCEARIKAAAERRADKGTGVGMAVLMPDLFDAIPCPLSIYPGKGKPKDQTPASSPIDGGTSKRSAKSKEASAA